MYTDVHPCTLMYTQVHPCALMCTHVHPCTLMHTHVHSCKSMYTHVYQCTSMYTQAHPCILMYTHVHPGALPVKDFYTIAILCTYLHLWTPCTLVYNATTLKPWSYIKPYLSSFADYLSGKDAMMLTICKVPK